MRLCGIGECCCLQLCAGTSSRHACPLHMPRAHAHTFPCGCRCFVSTAQGIVAAFQRTEMRRRLACCVPRLLGVGPAHYAHLADRAYWCRKYAKANAVSAQLLAAVPGKLGMCRTCKARRAVHDSMLLLHTFVLLPYVQARAVVWGVQEAWCAPLPGLSGARASTQEEPRVQVGFRLVSPSHLPPGPPRLRRWRCARS